MGNSSIAIIPIPNMIEGNMNIKLRKPKMVSFVVPFGSNTAHPTPLNTSAMVRKTNKFVNFTIKPFIPKKPPSRRIPVVNSSWSIIAEIVTFSRIKAPESPIPKQKYAINAEIGSEMNIKGDNVAMNAMSAEIIAFLTPNFFIMYLQKKTNPAAERNPVAKSIERTNESLIPSTKLPYRGVRIGKSEKQYHNAKSATIYVLKALLLNVYFNEFRNDGAFSGSLENSILSFAPNFIKSVADTKHIREIQMAAYL